MAAVLTFHKHKIGCMRSRLMGDPCCLGCRILRARKAVQDKRNRRFRKLASNGAAHSDRLVAARLSLRSDAP